MVGIGANWECPYCGHAQVLDDNRVSQRWHVQYVKGWAEQAYPSIEIVCIVCANNDCRKLTMKAVLGRVDPGREKEVHGPFDRWSLLPPSTAKPQPDYIPKPIRDDYDEACAIRDLSPKASATITRRCLQGMIRDFCGIKQNRLIDEINELRKRVEAGKAPPGVQPDTVVAIDNVRKIGNIGAHMEADINVIVDVDPDEAQTLIELVETLFSEWYVATHVRRERLDHLKSIADQKEQKKKGTAIAAGPKTE
jgi:hypothetical protein